MLCHPLIVLMYYGCMADVKPIPGCVGKCYANCGRWSGHCGSCCVTGFGYCSDTIYEWQVEQLLQQMLGHIGREPSRQMLCQVGRWNGYYCKGVTLLWFEFWGVNYIPVAQHVTLWSFHLTHWFVYHHLMDTLYLGDNIDFYPGFFQLLCSCHSFLHGSFLINGPGFELLLMLRLSGHSLLDLGHLAASKHYHSSVSTKFMEVYLDIQRGGRLSA